jgi:hypothetical protein
MTGRIQLSVSTSKFNEPKEKKPLLAVISLWLIFFFCHEPKWLWAAMWETVSLSVCLDTYLKQCLHILDIKGPRTSCAAVKVELHFKCHNFLIHSVMMYSIFLMLLLDIIWNYEHIFKRSMNVFPSEFNFLLQVAIRRVKFYLNCIPWRLCRHVGLSHINRICYLIIYT